MIRREDPIITHVRGSTFSYSGTATLPSGTWSATAKLRALSDPDTVVATFDVTLNAPVAPSTDHTILVEFAASEQEEWALEKHFFDVRFEDDSATPVVLHSPRIVVDVRQGAT
jgi:hypothetical protein